MNIIDKLQKRYSTKVFDPEKKLTEEQIQMLEDLLQLSPSSTNIQPWHFIVAASDEGKKRVAKAAQGFYAFNEAKVLNAGAVIIFASRVTLTEKYLNHISDKEETDGRYAKEEFKAQNHGARAHFAYMHKYELKDFHHWSEKQVYLNLGCFMFGVAAMDLDCIAMEGFDFNVLDKEFFLREHGYTSAIVVAVGYGAENDFNKTLPKSRLSKEEIIERV